MEQNSKRRALGRGLEDLFNISEDVSFGQFEEKIMETAKEGEIIELPIKELRANPYQPRKEFDPLKLEELAASIKEYGVLQPIIVKKSIKGYEIVAGERRFRASKLAGKETIPAIIREFTDNEMMEIAILENLQRENLNAIEEAEAYHSLMEHLHMTQEEVAKKVGKSRSHITNMLGLIALPNEVKKLIGEDKLSMGHARVLSKIDNAEKVKDLALKVVNNKLSVRETEKLASKEDFPRRNKIVRKDSSQREYIEIENNLAEYLGTKVKINNKKIEIYFANAKDLDRLLDLLNYQKD